MANYNIIIPARFASTRLPGKPLIDICGKTMIERVWRNAKKSQARDIIIATDDERIQSHAINFGAKICMTSSKHQSGTDRIIEVINQMGWSDDQVILNLQGDEPLLKAKLIDECASLLTDGISDIGTLGSNFLSKKEWLNPNTVKVLMDESGHAIYFSRLPIPNKLDADVLIDNKFILHHHGIYSYRCRILRDLKLLDMPKQMESENLEQLKALHYGFKIKVANASERPGPSIDVIDDVENVCAIIKKDLRSN
ncbi:MAG: 3-deoxy-manno-octulosonate cytidylyltransferase [Woeseiaceae bacterium]|tara:strand:- start:117 stop:875 length:759 start_codon:yes stop_codon:yes gene_type:complete